MSSAVLRIFKAVLRVVISMSFAFQIRMSVGAFYYYGRPMSKSNKVFKGQTEVNPGEGLMILNTHVHLLVVGQTAG